MTIAALAYTLLEQEVMQLRADLREERQATATLFAAERESHDATHALLDDALERIARAERCLENWPADGAVALRLLRGQEVGK